MTAHPDDRVPGAARVPRWLRWAWLAALVPIAVVAVSALALQHATWLRPLVQHYVRSHADRRIDFDALQIGLDAAWQPRITLRNLRLQNAPWAADTQPLIDARFVEFTLTWPSVFGARPALIPLLRVEDASVNLQRRADGLRNWRIAQPDDRGPGRARVLVLDAQRTRLRLVHDGIGLQMTVVSAPLDTQRTLPGHPELPLVRQLQFDGTRHGQPFHGQAATSARLSFYDTGEAFALGGGWLQAGRTRLAVDGTASSLFTLAAVDADLHLAGTEPGRVATVLGRTAAAWPVIATDARAHLHKAGRDWQWRGVQAVVGHSDAAGHVALQQPEQRGGPPMVQAALTSRRIDWAEWRAAWAARPADGAAHVAPAVAMADAAGSAPAGMQRWKALDADITWAVAHVDGVWSARPAALPVTRLQAHALLRGGHLRLDPLSFDLLGGRLTGSATGDASRAPADAALDLRATGLRMAELAALGGGKTLLQLTGELHAQAALRFHGDSTAALLTSTTGQVTAQLQQASLPPALQAELALDAGAWLRALFADRNAAVPVLCAEAAMQFQAGRGHSTRLAVETPLVQLAGRASVDLGQRSFDVLLTPHRKQTALLALDRSLQWHRSGGVVQRKLVEASVALDAAACQTPAPLVRTKTQTDR